MAKQKRFQASSKSNTAARIRELEEELSRTPYNKKTQHAIGMLKAKIARLREKQEKRSSTQKPGLGFGVRKTGDATVAMLGFPSVGKSTLLNQLTNAKSPVGAYDFTTLEVFPGLMEYQHARIQLLDIPGVIGGASKGKGRGREVLSIVRNSDLLLMMVDPAQPEQYSTMEKELYQAGIRLNQKQPDVKITRTSKDGIKIGSTVNLTRMNHPLIKSILREFRIPNAEVVVREDVDVDRFIDALEGNRAYLKAVKIVNKIDLATPEQINQVKKINPHLMVSAVNQTNLDALRQLIFDQLSLIRIYLKQPGKRADKQEPLIVSRGSTIKDACEKLHRDFVKKFKFARLWGQSSKFPGQRLRRLDHQLHDQDVLELHLD